MGQTQPTLRHDISRYSTKSVFEEATREYEEDNGLCCLYKLRRPINKDQVWKDYMLKQLSEPTSEHWPILLQNHLEMHNDLVADTRFRENLSDARLSQYQRKTFNESIKMQYSNQDKDVNINDSAMTDQDDGSVVVTCRILNRGDTKDMNNAIKTLLEATGMLEEKLLPSCYQEIFEPRMIEDRTKLNNSMAMSDVSRYSNDMNLSRNSNRMNISNSKSMVSRANFQSYKNNTVLNQIGTNYQERKNTREDINASEMQDCLLYYKQVTGNIEKHLKHEKNIFRQLIAIFEDYFIKKYQNKAFRMKDATVLTEKMAIIIQKATSDLQEFIRLIYNGLILFYDLQNQPAGKFSNNTYSIFNDDNMSNFVTTLIFNESIYNIMFSLYNTENHSLETAYKEQLETVRDVKPEDLDVAEEYCLNQKTIEYFRSRDFVLKEKANTMQFCPYENAITNLQALNHQKSPIHKSKTLLKTVESITKAIDRFYKDCGVKNTKSLTGEHVFPILCYIIAQSGITDVFSHCKIINEFSTSNIRSSMAGYYTSTLEICAKYISNLHLGVQ